MSDSAFLTTIAASDNRSDSRVVINANDALSRYMTVRNVTATETLSQNADLVLVDTSGGAVTLSLPDEPTDGDTYEIVVVDATATLTVDLDGGASDTMTGPSVTSDAYTHTTLWDRSIVTYDAANTNWIKRDG